MPTSKKYNLPQLFFLIVLFLLIGVVLRPELLPNHIQNWVVQNLGPNGWIYLLFLFLILFLLFLIFNKSFKEVRRGRKEQEKGNNLEIQWSEENIALNRKAKEAIKNADPEKALSLLMQIEGEELSEYVLGINARLSDFRLKGIKGIEKAEEQDLTYNRINQDILSLISLLNKKQVEGSQYANKVRTYLKQRYERRLNQKLAGRQAVNLRKLKSTDGTSESTSAAFVKYSAEEIQDGIGTIFKEAYERLLIVGAPGSGKTTLLLQLELSLLESESDALPVILNLATWKSEFQKLDKWLLQILPTELGVNKSLAQKLMQEYPLILLLDGFDEVKEADRNSCMEAIGYYGANSKNRFVITSRKKEYQNTFKDAPVNFQIEVAPLSGEQLEEELEKMGFQQPEAKPLLQALKNDSILKEAVKIPFYFNALQLMFGQGKRLHELNFLSQDVISRRNEIRDLFIKHSLSQSNLDPEKATQWLSFFAKGMNQHNLVNFELLDLQYSWYNFSKTQLRIGKIIHETVNLFSHFGSSMIGVFICFIFMIPLGIFPIPIFYEITFSMVAFVIGFGVLNGLIIGILRGLGRNLYENDLPIKTKEVIKVNLPGLKKIFIRLFKEILPLMLLVLGLLIMYIMLIQNVGEKRIDVMVDIIFGLTIVFIIGGAIMNYLQTEHYSFLQINKPHERFWASCKMLYFSILEHWMLKYLLAKKDKLPFQLVDFLNEMTQNNLLESDGATWRFRHKILQDWFAEQEASKS